MPEQTAAAETTATTVADTAATATAAAAAAQTGQGAAQTTQTMQAAQSTDAKGTAATPAASATTATLAEGTDKDGKIAPTDFPPDWRERMAGGDAALLTRLQRLSDPMQLAKTIREQDKLISQRSPAPTKPGDGATPEQIAEYRKAAGLPATEADYVTALKTSDGRTLGDNDKNVAAEFAKEVGGTADLTQEQFNRAVDWYLRRSEAVKDQLSEQDMAYRLQAEDKLREAFGADYRPNINAIGTLFDGAPEGLRDRILGGRLADGRKIGDDPAALTFLSNLSRQLNPLATIVPINGKSSVESVDTRIAEIETVQRTDWPAYWQNPAMQKEYQSLLTAREQAKKAGRAA